MFDYNICKTDDGNSRYKIMTQHTKIFKDLTGLGLSSNQVNVYILLVQNGNLRISEIVDTLNIPRSSVYECLRGLFDLGLAEEIIENSYKLIKPYPISALRHTVDERISELQNQVQNIDNLAKTMAKLAVASPTQATVVRYYKGRAGARQLFWNTLKAESKLYVYSEWGRGRYLGIKFYQDFVRESYERDFKECVITNPLPQVLDSIKQHINTPISRTRIENIRFVSENDIPFRGDTLMYDNIYAQVFLKNEDINGFEIESRQFVSTQRSIFEKLWESAQPLSELL